MFISGGPTHAVSRATLRRLVETKREKVSLPPTFTGSHWSIREWQQRGLVLADIDEEILCNVVDAVHIGANDLAGHVSTGGAHGSSWNNV